MYFRKKSQECLKSSEVMLKLILSFRSLLQYQALLVRRTDFLSFETTLNFLFFNYYTVGNRLEQRLFFFLKKKKELYMN